MHVFRKSSVNDVVQAIKELIYARLARLERIGYDVMFISELPHDVIIQNSNKGHMILSI